MRRPETSINNFTPPSWLIRWFARWEAICAVFLYAQYARDIVEDPRTLLHTDTGIFYFSFFLAAREISSTYLENPPVSRNIFNIMLVLSTLYASPVIFDTIGELIMTMLVLVACVKMSMSTPTSTGTNVENPRPEEKTEGATEERSFSSVSR